MDNQSLINRVESVLIRHFKRSYCAFKNTKKSSSTISHFDRKHLEIQRTVLNLKLIAFSFDKYMCVMRALSKSKHILSIIYYDRYNKGAQKRR